MYFLLAISSPNSYFRLQKELKLQGCLDPDPHYCMRINTQDENRDPTYSNLGHLRTEQIFLIFLTSSSQARYSYDLLFDRNSLYKATVGSGSEISIRIPFGPT